MAPYSPLPMGFSPRSPKHPHSRPFAHIFGQTIPRHSRPTFPSSSPIICGPESKGWMACLALSCFLVVVWLAALPDTPRNGRSVDIVFPDGLDMMDQGVGGLMWAYQEPAPIIGYGRGIPKRQAIVDDAASATSSETATVSVMGVPSEMPAGTSSAPVLVEKDMPGATPAPSSTASSARASSTTFSSPTYAEKPSAVTPDDDSTDSAEPPSDKPMERRRSRLRAQRANDYHVDLM